MKRDAPEGTAAGSQEQRARPATRPRSSAPHPVRELVAAPAGRRAVLQGNLAFAVGAVRGGIHLADGYPGTPSTEVIDKGLRHLQEELTVGWSVNEATALALGFGATMTGADVLVTMKIPGLFQAGDVVATTAGYTAPRGGLVIYVASDFAPSSTQHVFDPRYFLKSCFLPILEPRTHQELYDLGPVAAALGRRLATSVVVLASGLLCHSEGLVTLGPRVEVPPLDVGLDFKRFMNLPEIARRNYQKIVGERLPALQAFADETPLNRIEWHDRRLGVIVHGITELYLREVWHDLPIKPSVLSLGMTFPLPREKVRAFAAGLSGPVVVLGDGLRFVQEELQSQGQAVSGKDDADTTTEWTPETVARRLGGHAPAVGSLAPRPAPVPRPAQICAGCPYLAFGLAVQKLRKTEKIVASFGDIGCYTLLYHLNAIDTCTCMGAADSKRQGVVLAQPRLAHRVISVIGDSTECHSGLDSTRNAIFRKTPGVKVVLDNRVTAMTGGQPAPSSPTNLAGEVTNFDLVAALKGEGAAVRVVDAFDLKGVEQALRQALAEAADGAFTVLVLRGECMREVPGARRQPTLELVPDLCKVCDLCYVCPGIERDAEGYPRFTHLCTGCGGNAPICQQRCHLKALVPRTTAAAATSVPRGPTEAPARAPVTAPSGLPDAIRVATRGVGGQGILFFGKVLAEVALLCELPNVVKGETHGMAQLGGPVISTFACGQVHSPVLGPASADIVVALEESELLRPGFLELLKPDGVVVLNRLRLVPAGIDTSTYPSPATIRDALAGRQVVELDALAEARDLGDDQGRTANVIALGVLSTLPPLSQIPLGVWQEALDRASPSPAMKRANALALARGRRLAEECQ